MVHEIPPLDPDVKRLVFMEFKSAVRLYAMHNECPERIQGYKVMAGRGQAPEEVLTWCQRRGINVYEFPDWHRETKEGK